MPKTSPKSQSSQKSQRSQESRIVEGSHAIALTIKAISPAVISAYPITPQTHIVEDLAKFKADGEADYEFLRAESEFAAASIVLGASAAGSRVYTATSSQGLLLMTEVIYCISGMRLPVVMTCANRAISAPINIWNDQQDIHAVSNAGWIMLFAEDNQEAVDQHIMAYKIAEKMKLPVMLNIDGFVLTHTYEPVVTPGEKEIKKYLGEYKPTKGEYLDPKNPITMGPLVGPAFYMEMRQELHDDLMASLEIIDKEYNNYQKIFKRGLTPLKGVKPLRNNGLIEYYGPKNPKILLVAMGSVIGTIKDAADEVNAQKPPLSPLFKGGNAVGVLKIKCYRPFPAKEIINIIKTAKYVAVIDKAIAPGVMGPLANDIKAAACLVKNLKTKKIQSFVAGLGGRDITKEMIKGIIKDVQKDGDEVRFVGK